MQLPQELISAIIALLTSSVSYYFATKKKVDAVVKHVNGDEASKGLLSRTWKVEQTVINVDDRVAKLEKYFAGDVEHEGLLKRVKLLENSSTTKDTQEHKLLALQSAIIERLHQDVIKATEPLYEALDKKADKELLELKIAHIMDAIERIGFDHSLIEFLDRITKDKNK